MCPIVSIVIPCFNHGKYLNDAIGSVITSGDKSIYEIIIIDDGSTDEDTLHTLSKLEKDGYFILRQPNSGLAKARNNGIKQAKGKYIIPLDSDNKIKEGFIGKYSSFENDEKLDVLYGDYETFGDTPSPDARVGPDGIYRQGEFNFQQLLIGNLIDACAMFRKSTWEKMGGYDENMPVMGFEDWDFWLRIAASGGKFRYVREVLFEYRYLKNSMLRSVDTGKSALLAEYMQKKHATLMDKKYLNDLAFNTISKNISLTYSIFIRFNFPRVYNLLRKAGVIKDKKLIE